MFEKTVAPQSVGQFDRITAELWFTHVNGSSFGHAGGVIAILSR